MHTVRNTITVGSDRDLENGALIFLKRYNVLIENGNWGPSEALKLLTEDPEMQKCIPELIDHLKEKIETGVSSDLSKSLAEWDKFSFITKQFLGLEPWSVRHLFSLQAFEYKIHTQ